ncbi:MAG: sensor histidine kinase, partial [Bacteroidales bacterium]|nr:sensor histidine kinase [Bacteroidales bacterium]
YLIFFCLLLSIMTTVSAVTKAKNAELDLRNWDGKEIVSLDGEWEFYWDVLLYDSLHIDNIESPTAQIVDVPSYWTEYYSDSLKLPGKGFGSYRLSVLLPKDLINKELALDIPIFDDAYTLFINKKQVASNGWVSAHKQEAVPGYKPVLYLFKPDSEKLDIVIHVSNYKHRRGGFWKSIRLGESELVIHQKNIYEVIIHITIGLIISSILFFGVFFIFYTRNRKALFFSLSIFGILLRIISTDTFVIQTFSDPPWELLIRLEYLGTYIAFIFACWYFQLLYPNKIVKILLRMNSVLMALICLSVVVLEPDFFSYTILYFKPVVLLFFSYYLIVSFVYIFKRNENDEFYFAALLVFLAGLINDLRVSASASGIMNDYTIHFALQVFIFSHVILMIHSWIKAYKEKEKMNFQIEYLNLKLEKRIEDSEKELNLDKKELLDQKEEIFELKKKLKSESEFIRKIQSVLAQDMRSPIASVFQVSGYLHSSYGDGELKETVASIRDMSGAASTILDNLLFWTRTQRGDIQYSPHLVKVQDLLNELLVVNKIALMQKSIDADILVKEELTAFCDPQLIKVVLGNLFSNAIKYSKRNGRITLTATRVKGSEELILIFEDRGIGIPVDMLNHLNNPHKNEQIEIRKGTANEKGSGLGIILSQELLRINKGKMTIESTINKGTRVIVYLPYA